MERCEGMELPQGVRNGSIVGYEVAERLLTKSLVPWNIVHSMRLLETWKSLDGNRHRFNIIMDMLAEDAGGVRWEVVDLRDQGVPRSNNPAVSMLDTVIEGVYLRVITGDCVWLWDKVVRVMREGR